MIDMQVNPGLEREVHDMVEGYYPSDHECGQGVLGAHCARSTSVTQKPCKGDPAEESLRWPDRGERGPKLASLGTTVYGAQCLSQRSRARLPLVPP